MLELFPTSLNLPPGFSYQEEFLTPEEEAALVCIIENMPLHPMIFQGFEAKRKVVSFGYDYSFDKRQLSPGEPIPGKLGWLLTKVSSHVSIPTENFAEVLVTEYPVGSIINWHRDAPPFDVIVGISLSSDCIFKLRPYDKASQTRKATVSIPVARRSLYVIAGAARQDWQHSTAPLADVRYSITLRTLRK